MNKTTYLDPQYAFLNFHTFSSCFYSLGNVTDDASATSLPFNSPFGQVIHECILGYCNATADCARLDKYDKGHYGLQLFPNIGFRASACRGMHGMPLEPNADIAGPGACFSVFIFGGMGWANWCVQALILYVMQASMVLYIWLVVRVLDYLPATYDLLTGLFDKSSPKNSYRNRIRAQLIEKATKHRLIARFVLVGFQETQCYFMIAIQLASILALSRSPDMFDAGNLFQLVRDIVTTRSVSLGANVPITFGQWLLYKLDMESWYTLFCSSIPVLLSIATFSMSSHWKLKPDSLALSENKVFECGGQPPPLIWCAFEENFDFGKSTVEVTVPHAVSLACFVLLALLQVSPLARRTYFQRRADKFSPTHQWAMALRGLSVVIELGLVTMVILYPLIVLGLGILGTPVMVLFSDWNFGQVIAVSIWVPVILNRRRVILGYADPAPSQNHQHGNPTTTNGRPTREIVLVQPYRDRTGPDEKDHDQPHDVNRSGFPRVIRPVRPNWARDCACWGYLRNVSFHKAMDPCYGEKVAVDGDTQSLLHSIRWGMESTGTHGMD